MACQIPNTLFYINCIEKSYLFVWLWLLEEKKKPHAQWDKGLSSNEPRCVRVKNESRDSLMRGHIWRGIHHSLHFSLGFCTHLPNMPHLLWCNAPPFVFTPPPRATTSHLLPSISLPPRPLRQPPCHSICLPVSPPSPSRRPYGGGEPECAVATATAAIVYPVARWPVAVAMMENPEVLFPLQHINLLPFFFSPPFLALSSAPCPPKSPATFKGDYLFCPPCSNLISPPFLILSSLSKADQDHDFSLSPPCPFHFRYDRGQTQLFYSLKWIIITMRWGKYEKCTSHYPNDKTKYWCCTLLKRQTIDTVQSLGVALS